MKAIAGICLGVILFFSAVASSSAYVVDFAGLEDSTPVANQYSYLGLSFSGATVITAGNSLNEFEFPPHSGVNAAFDDGQPMTISFSTSVQSVQAYFTYASPLTLSFFDSYDAFIGTVTSNFLSNMAMSGDQGSNPNELLGFNWASGIGRLVITGDPSGSSFVMSDLTATPVPGPATIWLLGSGLMLVINIGRTRFLMERRSEKGCDRGER